MIKIKDEQQLLGEAVQRLSARYPSVSRATVAKVVHDQHARFSGAPIREFVPLFVERNAQTALAELSVPYDVATA